MKSLELLAFKRLINESPNEKINEFLEILLKTEVGKNYIIKLQIETMIVNYGSKLKKLIKRSPESWETIINLKERIVAGKIASFEDIKWVWQDFFRQNQSKSFHRVIIDGDLVKITWKDSWIFQRL
jgi:hypothetical protein